MNFDFSSLSTDTLLYFLTHSTAFVVTVASIFFTFGLGFGALTWGRYKWQRRRLQIENETLKDEVATLKRKVAEQAARASAHLEPFAEPERAPHETHARPDPVIDSFLNTAASILPQTGGQNYSRTSPHPEPQPTDDDTISITFRSKPHPEAEDTDGGPSSAEEELTDAKPAATPRRLHVRDLIDYSQDEVPPSEANAAEREQTASPAAEDAFMRQEDTPPVPSDDDSAHSSSVPRNGYGDTRPISDPHLGLIYASRPSLWDNLSHLKGVASVIEGRLNDFGVYTFKQIALWNEENIHEFSQRLSFKDRIRRERWVEQARELHFQKYGERV